MKERITVS